MRTRTTIIALILAFGVLFGVVVVRYLYPLSPDIPLQHMPKQVFIIIEKGNWTAITVNSIVFDAYGGMNIRGENFTGTFAEVEQWAKNQTTEGK